jgi:hypothetical protein
MLDLFHKVNALRSDAEYVAYTSYRHHLDQANAMSSLDTSTSCVRQAPGMVCAWLFLGYAVNAMDALISGQGLPVVNLMMGRMLLFAIPGALLGLGGGDAKGSAVGIAGGLLGCWVPRQFGETSLEPEVAKQLVIVAALVGATGISLVRILLWECAIVLRTISRFGVPHQRPGEELPEQPRVEEPFVGLASRSTASAVSVSRPSPEGVSFQQPDPPRVR